MSKVSQSEFLYRVSTRTHTMMPLLKASSLTFCSGCCIRQRPLASASPWLSLLPLSSSCYPALTMMNFQPNFGLWLFNVFPSFFAGSKINIYEYFNFHLGQHPPPQAQQAQLSGSSGPAQFQIDQAGPIVVHGCKRVLCGSSYGSGALRALTVWATRRTQLFIRIYLSVKLRS